MVGPRTVDVLLGGENHAKSGCIPIDSVEEDDEILPPKVFGIEVVVEDGKTRVSHRVGELLG
jgi:hypothetical protein